jgi:hypothetical protein
MRHPSNDGLEACVPDLCDRDLGARVTQDTIAPMSVEAN